MARGQSVQGAIAPYAIDTDKKRSARAIAERDAHRARKKGYFERERT
jgi:hypothetical protein